MKPVKKDNFHFTIIFFGEIDPEHVDKIKYGLSDLQFESINITYTNIGAFPNSHSPRVIWVGVDELGEQKLISLSNEVILKIRRLGFGPEKKFLPHLTLFRIRNEKANLDDIISQYRGRIFGSDTISKLVLKRSTLSPSGPNYSNIFTVYCK
jgi:RNA 2',3'-cyclic 3'-phosphodiesterase